MDTATTKKKRFGPGTCLVLIVLGLMSVGLLSARNVWSQSGGKPPEDAGVRYLCVGSVAVDLWPTEESDDAESHPELPMARAKRLCRPPLLPPSERSETVAAAVAPISGYGAVLEEWDAAPDVALADARAILEAAGWSETGGSKLLRTQRPDLASAAYRHDGAWLISLVVPRPNGSRTLILTAGVWPGLQERLR